MSLLLWRCIGGERGLSTLVGVRTVGSLALRVLVHAGGGSLSGLCMAVHGVRTLVVGGLRCLRVALLRLGRACVFVQICDIRVDFVVAFTRRKEIPDQR